MRANYLALMLINMTAGFVILAGFAAMGIKQEDRRRCATGLGMVGIVGLLTGLPVIWMWPLPGSFNVAFGEMTVLLAITFLGLAWALAKEWGLLPVGIYSFFAGLAAVVVGIWILKTGATQQPGIAGVGFLLSGLSGMLLLPTVAMCKNSGARVCLCVTSLLSAAIWALVGYAAYWSHLARFANYAP